MRTIFALLLLSCAATAADPVYPVTYSTPSPDGRFQFVMLAPPNADPKQNPDNTPQAKELRQKFSRSGMYAAGSTEPLWAVDWYAYEVYPANDGKHLVRLDTSSRMGAAFISGNRLPAETFAAQVDGSAISFLADGKVLKTYTLRDLIPNPDALPQSMTHVLWMTDGIVTKDGKRFVLSTHDSQQFVFELATGEIVSQRKAGIANFEGWKSWLIGGLTVFVIVFLGVFGVRSVLRKDEAMERGGRE
jgi:hypothetical protein